MSAKFEPIDLLQVLMDIARSGSRSHISSEFHRCANGSYAGSNAEPFSLTPTQRASLARDASMLPSGRGTPAKPIEDNWWVDQETSGWARQWEGDTDTSDPKSYK